MAALSALLAARRRS
ncbi:hypothetical protein ACFQL0_02905 [Haloplanus litoreus]